MIAVIGDGEICTPSARIPDATGAILHATGIASTAIMHDIRAMWIKPGSDIARAAMRPDFWRAGPLFGKATDWHMYTLARDGEQIPYYAAIRPISHQADSIIYNSIDREWLIPSDTDAQQIAKMIAYYEHLLGVQTSYSPARTALDALKRSCNTPARHEWLRPLSEAIYRGVEWPGERQLQHVNRACPQRRFVHVFDKNAAFMAACKHAFGAGDPVVVEAVLNDLYQEIIQGKAYGLWNVTAVNLSNSDDNLPGPFGREQTAIVNEWVYTPQIVLAAKMGWSVVIHHGYHWPNKHRILDDWTTRMWHARMTARQHPTLSAVEPIIKASFNRSRGLMSHPIDPGRPLKFWHRPDWNGTIAAVHYLRMMLALQKYAAMPDVDYLAVNIDSMALASDYPLDVCLPDILSRSNMPGGFRHEATFEGRDAAYVIEVAQQGGSAYKAMREVVEHAVHS